MKNTLKALNIITSEQSAHRSTRTSLPVLQILWASPKLEESQANQDRANDVDPDLRIHVRNVPPLVLHDSDGQKPGLQEERAIIVLNISVFEVLQ